MLKRSRDVRVLKRDPEEAIYAFSARNHAKMRAKPGDRLVFETLDCFGGQIKDDRQKFEDVGWNKINPATGPVYVEGAQEGDVLAVEILDIQVDSPGVMVAAPGMGAAGDRVTRSVTSIIPIKNGLAAMPQGVMLEIRPMIGVIGTAPSRGEIPCGTPGPHGGNLDTTVIAKGATVYLPVYVDGALLAMGDLHALMGDGEVLICGIEVAGEVEVKVDLVKGRRLTCPVVETERAYYVVWSAATLDEAAQGALTRSMDLLEESLGLSPEEVLALLSVSGNLQISQIVDPLKTVRMEIPKVLLRGKCLVR